MRVGWRLGVAGLIGLSVMAPSHAHSLEPRALNALFPGTFDAVVQGYTVRVTAHKDGSLVGRHAFSADSGRWSIRRGKLCVTLSNWLNGRTACAKVVRQGDWYRAGDVLFRKP
jgi:hypothetical protein